MYVMRWMAYFQKYRVYFEMHTMRWIAYFQIFRAYINMYALQLSTCFDKVVGVGTGKRISWWSARASRSDIYFPTNRSSVTFPKPIRYNASVD